MNGLRRFPPLKAMLATALLTAGALFLAACAGGASHEDVDALAAQMEEMGVQVGDLQAQVQAAAEAVSPKTHHLKVIMGEGEVIGETETGEEGEEIIGEFHRWEPPVLVVNRGDTVVLTVENPRGHVHSFVLTDFGIDTGELATRGGSATVEFVADKAGVFMWECGIDPADYRDRPEMCDLDHARQTGYLIVLER